MLCYLRKLFFGCVWRLCFGAVAVMAAAGCSSATTLAEGESTELISIAELKTESGYIKRSCTIRGCVTANDLMGEFPHRIVIEDEWGGVEVRVDDDKLFRRYPVGQTVEVICTGLTLFHDEACPYIGIPSDDPPVWAVRNCIPADRADRFLHPLTDRPIVMPEPRTLVITACADRFVGAYVRFERLHFDTPSETCWCEVDPDSNRPVTTNRQATDSEGNTLTVRTSGSCEYARERLPQGDVSLSGILGCFNRTYQLRLVNHDIEPFREAERRGRTCLDYAEARKGA